MTEDRPNRQKIAIIGYTSHKALAPWQNREWEIWGLNDLYLDLGIFQNEDFDYTRLKWFQLHSWQELRDWDKAVHQKDRMNPQSGPIHPRDPNHILWLSEASKLFPVYLRGPRPELPSCLLYPFPDVFKYFSKYYTADEEFRYFTNSITFMVALAVMQLCPDPDETPPEGAQIGIWGVDMQVAGPEGNSEYGYQRPSCEWIIGYCMGRGIQLTLPAESDLCKTAFVYGDEEEFYLRKRIAAHKADLEQRRIMAVNQREQSRFVEGQMIGAINTVNWFERSHLPGDDGMGQVPIAGGHNIPMG